MSKSRFVEALRSGRVLLMDGGMGTELQRAGIQEGECYELWNLTHPERVRAIHQAYVDAGAEVLLTNTFQARRETLLARGLSEGEWERINRTAVELARSVGDGQHFVLASIGPPPDLWTDSIPEWKQLDAVADDCLRQIECCSEADGIVLETQACVDMIAAVLRREPTLGQSLPLLVSFTFACEDGSLFCTPKQALPEAMGGYAYDHREHLTALGVNCGRDVEMSHIVEAVRCYRSYTALPLFARPNAGTPRRGDNRWIYPHTPQAMAEHLPALLEAGVNMVGGCCGTTPEHIAAFRPIIDQWNRRRGH
jgi:5-methyltetrahydrofolate--homocysteine methyltransferase